MWSDICWHSIFWLHTEYIHLSMLSAVCRFTHCTFNTFNSELYTVLSLSIACKRHISLLLPPNMLLVWISITLGMLSLTTQIQVPVMSTSSSSYTTCTCFTIWRDYIWVGTNRGIITVMDTATGERDHEIFFAGGRRQTEIKHLALSSEDEVRVLLCCIKYVISNPNINFM